MNRAELIAKLQELGDERGGNAATIEVLTVDTRGNYTKSRQVDVLLMGTEIVIRGSL